MTYGENSSETPVGRKTMRSGDPGRCSSNRRLLRSRQHGSGLGDRGGVMFAATPPKDLLSEVGEVWKLGLPLSKATDPKIPSRANKRHKFAESEGGSHFRPRRDKSAFLLE